MDPAVAREMLTTTQHNVPDTLTPVVQGQPQCTVVFGPLTGLIFNFDKPPGSKDPYTCFYLGDFQPGGLKGFLDTALHEAHPEHAEELKFYISNNRYPAAEFVRVFHAGTWMSLKRARGAIALGQGAHGQQDNQPVQLQEEELELESTDTNEEEQVEEAEVDGEEEEEVEEEEEEEEDLQAAAPEVEQVEETEEEEEEEEDQEEEDHEGEQDEAAAAALLQAAALALDHGSAGLEDAEPMSAQEGGLARQAPGLHAGASVPAEGSSGSSGTCNGASRAACLQGSAPSAALAGPPLAGNEQQGKASKLNVEMGMKGYPTRAWGLAGTCLGMLFCILAFFMMQGLVKRPLEAVIVQLESQLATASADLLLWKQAPQHSHQENLQLESQLSAATTQLHSYQAANLQLESQLAVANTRLGIAYLGLGVLAAAVMCMLLGTSRRILHGRSGMENKSNNFVSLAAKELPAQNTPRKAEEGTQTDMHMTNNESKIVELESKLCGVDDRYKVHVARLEEENNALRVKQEYAQAQLESSVRATVLAQAALAERNEELSFLKQTDARAHQLFELKELLDSAKELLNSVRSAFGGTQMSEQITDPKDVLSKIVSWMDWAQGHELEADDAPHAARDQYDI